MIGRADDIYFSHIQKLLTDFDKQTGLWNYLFDRDHLFDTECLVDPDGIKNLREFSKLKPNDSDVLSDQHVKALITILENRFNRIRQSNRSYRTKPYKMANKIFMEIALRISKRNNDSKILMLVQYYKNDYAMNKSLLYQAKENLFYTQTEYVYVLDDLIQHMQKTMSYTYPVTYNNEKIFGKLTFEDLENLRKIPAALQVIQKIAESFAEYKSQEAMDSSPLIKYPAAQRFLTEDKYCFLIDDIISAYKNQNKFYNFFTEKAFSEKDLEKLIYHPEISKLICLTKVDQLNHASHISDKTISQLAELADGILNHAELLAEKNSIVNKAQHASDKFNLYYFSLSDKERFHLDEFWIEKFPSVFFTNKGNAHELAGQRTMKFKDLYASLNATCMHTVSGALLKMLIQLRPNITEIYKFKNSFAVFVLGELKAKTKKDSDFYVADVVMQPKPASLSFRKA